MFYLLLLGTPSSILLLFLLYTHNIERFNRILINLFKIISQLMHYNNKLANYITVYKNKIKYFMTKDKIQLIENGNSFIYNNYKSLLDDITSKNVSYDFLIKKHLIDDNIYYQIIKDTNNIEKNVEITKTHFIQIEIQNKKNNTYLDITKEIDHFYLDKNIILGHNFLKWFLKEYKKYDLNEKEDYKIIIIDNNIESLELDHNYKIELYKDSYKVIQ